MPLGGRSEEIDNMKEKDTLKRVYNHLETKQFFDSVEIGNIEKRFQNLHNQYKQNKYKDISRWEMFVWGFRISSGKVLPIFSQTSKDGKVISEYPCLKDMDENTLSYFKNRTLSVKSDFLKSRYNHILWESKSKHKIYAVNAIDSYIKLISKISTEIQNHQLSDLCKSLLKLSHNSRYKILDTVNCLKFLIENDVLEDFYKLELGCFYLENYTNEALDILKLVFKDCSKNLENMSIDLVYYPEICNDLIKIGKKLKKDYRWIYQKKADYYLNIAENEDSWIKQDHYFNAIQIYLEMGAKEKTDELYVLIENSKEEIRMGAVKKEFDGIEIQSIFKHLHEKTEKLTNLESEKIYEYLALSDSFLPKAKVFHKKPKESFFDILNTTSFDINSNFSKSDNRNSISEYWLHLSNFTIRELSWIFQKGIIKGSMTYETLILYLYNKSWIGKTYTINDYDGKPQEYCWLHLIAPAFFDFFSLSDSLLKRKEYANTGYVLCIDSLTLKIEGLIRHFAKLIQCPTIIINKKKNGTRERYIEEIISHEKFKKYFSEEDLILITYVMTSKGMNVRNNIAHSFYKYENYSPSIMFLLITVILRLSKFELNIKRK